MFQLGSLVHSFAGPPTVRLGHTQTHQNAACHPDEHQQIELFQTKHVSHAWNEYSEQLHDQARADDQMEGDVDLRQSDYPPCRVSQNKLTGGCIQEENRA